MNVNKSSKKLTAGIAALVMMFASMSSVFALESPAVQTGYIRYEAEAAKLTNGASSMNFGIENHNDQSGGKVVGGFATKKASDLNYDFSNSTSVRFEVERSEAGVVEVILGFRSSQESNMAQRCANIPIKCNDGSVKELEVGVNTSAEAPRKQVSVKVDMQAGRNYVYVAGPVAGGGWINIDYIDVSNATEPGSVEPKETEATPMPVNPFVKTIYTADPSAHVWKNAKNADSDKLYVYPSHDRYPSVGCDRMDAYHIFSTTNMTDFTDEGEIFSAYDLEWGREALKSGKFDDGTFMWAPDCAYSEKNGKYYFYYPHPADNDKTEWRVGVAVSDYPDHGFVDSGIPIAGIGGPSMIDPAVFTDPKTGDSYLYLGGGGNAMNGCAVAKLNDDMVTLAEEPHIMYVEGADKTDPKLENGGIPNYHEGPFVVYNEDTDLYYFMYADGYNTIATDENGNGIKKDDGSWQIKPNSSYNRQRYLTSKSPVGPWTIPTGENTKSDEPDHAYGVVLDPVSSNTSHGSLVNFKDQWYIFYHNMNISGEGALRSITADKVTFAADGSINKVVQTDGSGLIIGECEVLKTPDKVMEAENAEFGNANEDSVQPTVTAFEYNDESVSAVTNLMLPGAYIQFNDIDGGENGCRVNVRIRYSAKERCYARLRVNGRDYSLINLRGTGGKGFFSGESNITVQLNPGNKNAISLTEFNNIVSLDKIELRYLGD